ncbi:MAG TPA: tetratricopeptide repeat protein [Phycisphaerae bacterium]|nr:tetratricopeptide repeat protein [Phycisphaerae bacterium]HRW54479.1 tetratricopeptide repeat protein [Phycisphaerae bacterium]
MDVSPPSCHARRVRFLSILSLLLMPQLACISNQPNVQESLTEGHREFRRGRYAEALGMYELAEDTDPERPEPSYYIGKVYLAMADRQFMEDDLPGALRYCDRAIATFDKSISAFPGYSRALQGKAEALKLRGKHQAVYDIARWVSTQSAFESKKLIVEARQYSSSGDLDNAQLLLVKAVAVDPRNAAPHAELGRFYMRIGNKPKAIASLSEAYRLDPAAPGVFKALLELGATPAYPRDSGR